MQKDEQSRNSVIKNLSNLVRWRLGHPWNMLTEPPIGERGQKSIYLLLFIHLFFTSIYLFILVWSWASRGHRWDMLTELPIGEKRSKAKCPCWTNSIYFPCSKNISGSYKYHAFDHGNQLCENCEISNSYVVFDLRFN